jgi:AcrR family transcriptional regulator
MGNREDLLDSARRCLYEKGYSRTTARDIASGAGVSLAAIGYHYGTKEALLHAALRQALEAWGDDLGAAMAAAADVPGTPAERFEAAWDGVLRSFAANRALWSVQFELVGLIDRDPALKETFADSGRQARLALVDLFGDAGVGDDPERRLALGALYQALLAGTASQWLADPASPPSAAEFVRTLRTLATSLTPSA